MTKRKEFAEVCFKNMFRNGEPMQKLLPILLKDQTTGKNIIWATDTYEQYGSSYNAKSQMFQDLDISLITNGCLLPRVQKTKEQQLKRTKMKAEVFTPSYICNRMNNFCDEQWFGHTGLFNKDNNDGTWDTNEKKIPFRDGVKWQEYVNDKRIEVACGEAPYLVSRYDTVTGEAISLKDRIGILDRKLRVVNENATQSNWLIWVYKAFKATYAFELQGDNLFFARVNLVQTFIDYYKDEFKTDPPISTLKHIATIVSWNVWQMDILTDCPPFMIHENSIDSCDIKEWSNNKDTIKYRTLKGE